MKTSFPKANKEIKAKEVRLIDADGSMVGVVSLHEALKIATDRGLDLVEVSPNAEPPVCKVIDFGKYKYEIQKKANEAKKKQKVIEIKEIKLRPNIGKGDYDVKLRSIKGFIEDGDKVKVTLKFRGREIAHDDIGMDLMRKLKEDTAEFAKAEIEPKMEGKQILMVLVPV
ncbi:MAG: translation initiation factor IF-3 [Alphaproteobacteria bacterium 33-17]|nr:MAG: translation initiation factor IF-3 [Alphaproteobacteria bacterium 33-17]